MTNAVLRGKPNAENPHIRLDDGHKVRRLCVIGALLAAMTLNAAELPWAPLTGTEREPDSSDELSLSAPFTSWWFGLFVQGIFLTQGSNPRSLMSPALACRFFTTSATWEAHYYHTF